MPPLVLHGKQQQQQLHLETFSGIVFFIETVAAAAASKKEQTNTSSLKGVTFYASKGTIISSYKQTINGIFSSL